MKLWHLAFISFYFFCQIFAQSIPTKIDFLGQLVPLKDFKAKRISSYDRTGGNNDRFRINVGETIVFAEIKGPGIITHFWNTIMPEPFYSAKVVLRVYWDDEVEPSIEAPIGDFFCMGHGIDRRFSAFPMDASSEGRSRNSYWQMPFKKSAKFTVTNEGEIDVVSFYFHIDYIELKKLPENTPYFHAQYRQEYPCQSNENYLILDAEGKGHYVGCSMSVLQKYDFWWGEGDDMIYVDGEKEPSIHGTGMEDAFSNAWGMYEAHSLFYGCPFTESDFTKGSKASFFRFNVMDPIPFKKSIKVTIEHGTNNNRSDNFSSVAYWYQLEPHKVFFKTPHVSKRIPYAFNISGYKEGKWNKTVDTLLSKEIYSDEETKKTLVASSIEVKKSMFYEASGNRYKEFRMFSPEGDSLEINNFSFEKDKVKMILFYKTDKKGGKFKIKYNNRIISEINTYSQEEKMISDTLGTFILNEGNNKLFLIPISENGNVGRFNYIYLENLPIRYFIPEWNIVGPFYCENIEEIDAILPPEKLQDSKESYFYEDKTFKWEKITPNKNGLVDILARFPNCEHNVAYLLTYIYSPFDYKTKLIMGTDDGTKIWVNDKLIYKNPVCQFAYLDHEKVEINLKKGWNKLFVKIGQFLGLWEMYMRIQDPDGILKYSVEKQ